MVGSSRQLCTAAGAGPRTPEWTECWKTALIGADNHSILAAKFQQRLLSVTSPQVQAASPPSHGPVSGLVELTPTAMKDYNSRGHPKAKRLEILLKYPADWEAVEGLRPHVVQKFVKRGVGDNCNLEVHNLQKTVARSKVRSVAAEANNSGLLEGFKMVRQQDVLMDSLPAVSTLSVGKLSTAAFETAAMILTTSTIYKSNLISLTCVGTDSNSYDELRKKLVLFVRVQNSLIIQNQWTKHP